MKADAVLMDVVHIIVVDINRRLFEILKGACVAGSLFCLRFVGLGDDKIFGDLRPAGWAQRIF